MSWVIFDKASKNRWSHHIRLNPTQVKYDSVCCMEMVIWVWPMPVSISWKWRMGSCIMYLDFVLLVVLMSSRKSTWARQCLSLVEFSETFGLGLEIQDLGCQDQVLVLVLTKFSNQDQSWYWSSLKFYFKICLGLVWKLVSREGLVLV